MKNKIIILTYATILMLVTACDGEKRQDVKEEISANTQTVKKKFEIEEWRKTFRSTFKEVDVKKDGEGGRTYEACFLDENNGNGKDCNLSFSGKHDGFRKIDHFTPAYSAWRFSAKSIQVSESFAGTYFSLLECSEPVIFIVPIVKKHGWLFMSRIALMADGDVVLDQPMQPDQVAQEILHADFVKEESHLIFSGKALDDLEKFSIAKENFIRISGKNGKYITIDGKNLAFDLKNSFIAIKKINEAMKIAGGPSCTKT